MHIYIHLHISKYIYIYIHTYIHIRMYSCENVRSCMITVCMYIPYFEDAYVMDKLLQYMSCQCVCMYACKHVRISGSAVLVLISSIGERA